MWLYTHKERDEDGGVHKNQAQDGGPAVAETIRDGSSQENTDKSTTLTGLEEGTLPSGGDSPHFRSSGHTVSLLESTKRDKVTVQEHIERLHDLKGVSYSSAQNANFRESASGHTMIETYNCEAHDECPKTSPRITLDCRPRTHLMLAVLTIKSMVHEIRVDHDLRMMGIFLLVEIMIVLVQRHLHVNCCSLSQFEGDENRVKEKHGESRSYMNIGKTT